MSLVVAVLIGVQQDEREGGRTLVSKQEAPTFGLGDRASEREADAVVITVTAMEDSFGITRRDVRAIVADVDGATTGNPPLSQPD